MNDNHEKARSPFWHVNLGHILTLGITLAAVLISYGRISERLETYGSKLSEHDSKIAEMDKNGTMASQNKIQLEANMLNDHAQRLARTEDALADLKVIKFKVDQLYDEMKGHK